VTSVTSGSVVTLTASVSAGSTKVTKGQVNFCDASVSYCTDIHLLGTAQLTSVSTAILALRPRFGSQAYKAVFAGTKSNAASTSATADLAVTGGAVTSTQIAQSGNLGAFTLTATVSGVGSAALTGNVSFLNASHRCGTDIHLRCNRDCSTRGRSVPLIYRSRSELMPRFFSWRTI
jgi:hypothetical protein